MTIPQNYQISTYTKILRCYKAWTNSSEIRVSNDKLSKIILGRISLLLLGHGSDLAPPHEPLNERHANDANENPTEEDTKVQAYLILCGEENCPDDGGDIVERGRVAVVVEAV
jgi:hypothetical protein